MPRSLGSGSPVSKIPVPRSNRDLRNITERKKSAPAKMASQKDVIKEEPPETKFKLEAKAPPNPFNTESEDATSWRIRRWQKSIDQILNATWFSVFQAFCYKDPSPYLAERRINASMSTNEMLAEVYRHLGPAGYSGCVPTQNDIDLTKISNLYGECDDLIFRLTRFQEEFINYQKTYQASDVLGKSAFGSPIKYGNPFSFKQEDLAVTTPAATETRQTMDSRKVASDSDENPRKSKKKSSRRRKYSSQSDGSYESRGRKSRSRGQKKRYSSSSSESSGSSSDSSFNKSRTSKSLGRQVVQMRGWSIKDAIPTFSAAKASSADARKWIEDFDLQADEFGWDKSERCTKIRTYLDPTGRNWIDQLDKRDRKKWKSLKSAFMEDFGAASLSYQRQYYDLRQRDNESLTHYFFRYNSMAVKARIDYKGRRFSDHVDGFRSSINDESLSHALHVAQIRSIKDLKEILESYERKKKKDRSKSKTDPRKYGADRVPDQKKINHFHPSRDRGYDSGGSENTYDQDEYEINAVNPRPKCEKCGKPHETSACWRDQTCTHCGATGHPATVCGRVCKACRTVHSFRDECPVVKQLQEVSQWMKDQGITPPPHLIKPTN